MGRHNPFAEQLSKFRMATTLDTLRQAGAQVVYGDMKDPPSLAAACQGIETVITTANSVLRGGEDNIESVDHQGNLSLIAAAKNCDWEAAAALAHRRQVSDERNKEIAALIRNSGLQV